MSAETTDAETPGDDVEDPFERLETVLADRLAANAELLEAVEACLETGAPASPGLYESLVREARSDTETVKRLLTSQRFEIDLSQADVDAWDAIQTPHDDTEDDDDRPFR